MKKEDLMIGDWVIRRGVPEEPMRLYDMKVSAGLACLDQDGRGVAEKFENIEPIPLTSEILEKNGLSRENSCTEFMFAYCEYKDNKGDFDLYICNGFRKGSSCGEINEFQFTAIRYVHELQHALKLCKIEKEIIL